LDALLADRLLFTGAATEQVAAIVAAVATVVSRYPDAASYRPGAIL
jgi:adenylosuccinate lyase